MTVLIRMAVVKKSDDTAVCLSPCWALTTWWEPHKSCPNYLLFHKYNGNTMNTTQNKTQCHLSNRVITCGQSTISFLRIKRLRQGDDNQPGDYSASLLLTSEKATSYVRSSKMPKPHPISQIQ